MSLIRFFLMGLIVFLITRAFILFGHQDKSEIKKPEPDKGDKKISKSTGEYIDFEDPGQNSSK